MSWSSSAKSEAAGSLDLTSLILHPYAAHLLFHPNLTSVGETGRVMSTFVKTLRYSILFLFGNFPETLLAYYIHMKINTVLSLLINFFK